MGDSDPDWCIASDSEVESVIDSESEGSITSDSTASAVQLSDDDEQLDDDEGPSTSSSLKSAVKNQEDDFESDVDDDDDESPIIVRKQSRAKRLKFDSDEDDENYKASEENSSELNDSDSYVVEKKKFRKSGTLDDFLELKPKKEKKKKISDSKEETYFDLLYQLEKDDLYEEDVFGCDEIVEDGVELTCTHDCVPIRELQPKIKATFCGVVRWKKEGFVSNPTRFNPNGLFICRIRVGDSSNYSSFIQINSFGKSARWMNDNMEEGQSYQFNGLRIKNSGRRYNPLSHKAECTFDLNYSTLPKPMTTPSSFPHRMYYNFQSFGKIVTLTSSTCLEIIGVVQEVDQVVRKGAHYIRRVVVVDMSLYKLEFYLWNGDAIGHEIKKGMTVLLQGLKVQFMGNSVAFAVLRCKYLEFDSRVKESNRLKTWWCTGGFDSSFKNFPQFENRIQRFVNAFNDYKLNEKKNDTDKTKEKLTLTSLASKYGVTKQSLSEFFISNGIRFHQVHVKQPEIVKKLVQKSVDRKKGQTLTDVLKGTNVKIATLSMARSHAGVTKKRRQNKKNPSKVADLRQKYLNREKGQNMADVVKGSGVTIQAVSRARCVAGETNKHSKKAPHLVARAVVYLLDDPKATQGEAANVINQNENNKSKIRSGSIKRAIYVARKKHGEAGWEQYFRDFVRKLDNA